MVQSLQHRQSRSRENTPELQRSKGERGVVKLRKTSWKIWSSNLQELEIVYDLDDAFVILASFCLHVRPGCSLSSAVLSKLNSFVLAPFFARSEVGPGVAPAESTV